MPMHVTFEYSVLFCSGLILFYLVWIDCEILLQLLGLPDIDDDTFDQYHADVEEEPEPDHQQMGVSQQ